ncbi:MAG: hypothetical protein IPP93_11375 [Chitinophagaceae bacterium]|nr:hypothetical protein [Chitinophagaceae bacterium]
MTNPRFKQTAGKAIRTVLLGWLIAGTLDICAACTQYFINTGKGPQNVLRFVASGYFGKEALSGGWEMAAWGLLFHFIIAFVITLVFFLIYPWLKKWIGNIPLMAIGIGLAAWTVMNLIVVPNSNTPPIHRTTLSILIAMGILIVCIGLPLAVVMARYYRKQRT